MENLQVKYGWDTADEPWSNQYLLPAVTRVLARICPDSNLRVLDIGCGNGFIANQLASRGFEMTAIDPSNDGIKIARRSFSGISFHCCSVYDDDIKIKIGAPFDCVVSLEVIEHLFLPRRLLEQSFALLNPGGYLVLSTPYHGYLKNLALAATGTWDRHHGVHWDGGHIKFFSRKTLARMATDTGFRDVGIKGIGRVTLLWKSMLMVARKPQ